MENPWRGVGLALATALAVALMLGPLLIPLLRRLKFGQRVRDDGPQRHLTKAGTPTMGGIIFLVAITAAVLAWAPRDAETFTVLFLTLGYGLIGLVDDYTKIVLKRPLGLRAREKLLGQILLGLLLGMVAVWGLKRGTSIEIPFYRTSLELGGWYLAFAAFITVGFGNAVNLTDGLDGLAAGTVAAAAAAYIPIALVLDKTGLALFAAAVAGGCLGFLAFNHHPARVFMGDTGSLALGGALASLAIITRTELILLLIGGVFVLETLSVIIQVVSYQTTGRRVLLMAPLHHHFELAGWSETGVVRAFWAAAFLFAVLGIMVVYSS
ncbi:MAG: phospho-N-acetylmuramoyl-pentapeptide-transferase [Syntrophomonadaceae bacterium]|nr:phospho-N-acetylmuramoyl-pentapeptide-transferase [Syntrophomonadaceae bacterium]